MTATNDASLPAARCSRAPVPAQAQRRWAARRRWRRPVSQDIRAGARRLARRLVLAARVRPAGEAGPQGVHADAHRRRRALAPPEQGHQSRHPHHRHRQRVQMGGPQGRLPGRAFLRRLAGLRRAGADRRPRLVDRLARRVQAGERPARVSTLPPSSAAKPSWRRSRRASPAGRRRRRRHSVSSAKRTAPGSIRRPRRSPTAWRCSRSS